MDDQYAYVKNVKLAAEIIWITPEIAGTMLATRRNARKVSIIVVTRYAREMERGRWWIGPAIVFDSNGNLIDGQHRLQAIINYGHAVPFIVVRGVPPESGVVFDQGKVRTLLECFGIAGKAAVPAQVAALNLLVKFIKGDLSKISLPEAEYWLDKEIGSDLRWAFNSVKEPIGDVGRGTTTIFMSAFALFHKVSPGFAEKAAEDFNRVLSFLAGESERPPVPGTNPIYVAASVYNNNGFAGVSGWEAIKAVGICLRMFVQYINGEKIQRKPSRDIGNMDEFRQEIGILNR